MTPAPVPVRLGPLGLELLAECERQHPRPWRVTGPHVVDAVGGVVVEATGGLAAVVLAVAVVDEVIVRAKP